MTRYNRAEGEASPTSLGDSSQIDWYMRHCGTVFILPLLWWPHFLRVLKSPLIKHDIGLSKDSFYRPLVDFHTERGPTANARVKSKLDHKNYWIVIRIFSEWPQWPLRKASIYNAFISRHIFNFIKDNQNFGVLDRLRSLKSVHNICLHNYQSYLKYTNNRHNQSKWHCEIEVIGEEATCCLFRFEKNEISYFIT